MSQNDDLPITPLDSEGFWAHVRPPSPPDFSFSGFVTQIKIGAFDYLRVDYLGSSARHRGFSAHSDEPDKIHTWLFPANALPILTPTTKEDVYGQSKAE